MVLVDLFMGNKKARYSNQCDSCLLRLSCFMARLSQNNESAKEQISRNTRNIQKGEFLFKAGHSAGEFYIVKVGAIQTLSLFPRGENTVLALHLPGDIVGATSLPYGRHAVSAKALVDSRVCELPWNQLTQLTPEGLGFALSISDLISREVEHGYERIITMSMKQPIARVANFILSYARRMERLGLSQSAFVLPIGVSDLAKYLSLARETVSRQIGALKKYDIIESDGRLFKIIDAEGLRDIVEDVYHLSSEN